MEILRKKIRRNERENNLLEFSLGFELGFAESQSLSHRGINVYSERKRSERKLDNGGGRERERELLVVLL